MTDFSKQCPIFKTGVKGEYIAPFQLSCTNTATAAMSWTPQREVIVEQILLHSNASDGLSVAISTTIRFFTTASTCIGSISNVAAALAGEEGTYINSASLISTSLGSTDTLTAWIIEAAGACKPNGNFLVVRYRER